LGYGYGVGYVKASADIPIKNLRVDAVANAFTPYKLLGTTTNYQVPTSKTALIALERTIAISNAAGFSFMSLVYADDPAGTNFVSFGTLPELDLNAVPSEKYWVFSVPSGKFILLRNNSGYTYSGILVLFEV
jgi:hypothetical protein